MSKSLKSENWYDLRKFTPENAGLLAAAIRRGIQKAKEVAAQASPPV